MDMVKNDYIGLLQADYINVKHPLDNKRVVRLYRTIAIKSFRIKTWGVTIGKYDIGGYVESLENIENAPLWIDGTEGAARVFDDACIMEDSFIKNNVIVFGKAKISRSLLTNYARVHGNSVIMDSTIRDMAEIKGNAKVTDSEIVNSAMVFGNAIVRNSKMGHGSSAFENVNMDGCKLEGTAKARGNANLINCKLINESFVEEGDHKNETFNREVRLEYRIVKPDDV